MKQTIKELKMCLEEFREKDFHNFGAEIAGHVDLLLGEMKEIKRLLKDGESKKYLVLKRAVNNKMNMVKNLFNHLIDKEGKMVSKETLVEGCRNMKIDENDTDFLIEELKKQGSIFEPKEGFLQVI